MQAQGDYGEALGKEWHSKFSSYKSKYPEEAAEFQVLLNGGLVPDWENSLPV